MTARAFRVSQSLCFALQAYELLVGDDLCTVDLLTMLLSRENGGKAPCEHVWRCDV